MIASWKVNFVLIGHSERRAMGETDAFINQKVLSAIKHGATPILCVGEKVRDEHGFFLRTVEEQLKNALVGVSKSALERLVIAYEPLWAIGKDATREATAEECREMVIFIKKVISDMLGGKPKILPRILYGGSVNELNAYEFIQAGADGLLPGRLSLEPKKMQKLIRSLSVIATTN
jgi:triosephosphate isomerase